MSNPSEELESFRKKLDALEQRESDLGKRIDKLVGKLDGFDPELNALMREGLPLDLYTRTALITNGYEVHGYYPYHLLNTDGIRVERSIDIYASRESIYTVPADGGRLTEKSWLERNNLLVECKQRRESVRWLFCYLPTSKKEGSIAGKDVPIVNAGFELRPSNDGFQSSANPKDVKNAIAQLNEAHIPFLMSREIEITPNQRANPYYEPKSHEHTWLLLVTNAVLKVFQPPSSFEELLIDESRTGKHFTEVPWLIFKPDHTLSLMTHQQSSLSALKVPEKMEMSIPRILAEHTHEVHIVNFKHLSGFLSLVADPPRVKSISISLKVDGGPETMFEIK